MGLDIRLRRLYGTAQTGEDADYLILDERDKELFSKAKLMDKVFPRMEEYFDIEGYLTKVAVPGSRMDDWRWRMTFWPEEFDDICWVFRYVPTDNDYEVRGANVGIYKEQEQVVYCENIGYQRKGMKLQFFKDFNAGKLNYLVLDKATLEMYRDTYVNDDMKEHFQENIIDPFVEGEMVVTFSW